MPTRICGLCDKCDVWSSGLTDTNRFGWWCRRCQRDRHVTLNYSHAYRLAVTITCPHCDEHITAADKTRDLNMRFHEECFIRMIAGSAKHQVRRCSCYGFQPEDEEPGLTKREWAMRASMVFRIQQEMAKVEALIARRLAVLDNAYSA